MAAVKVETKVALLLIPHELGTKYRLLESLHIEKSAKGIFYEAFDLQSKELNKHYSNLPPFAKDLLVQFSPDAYAAFNQKLTYALFDKKATEEEKALIKTATLRHFYQLFDRLKPFRNIIKWYHKARNVNAKSFRTAPCVFSSYKPQLNFHVAKEKARLTLKIEVILNGASYNINEFNRYHFLLESSNEYFLLSYKDYQTLEWIADNERGQYGHNPIAFSKHILAKLEQDYKVNRYNFFPKKEIKTLPVNRVLLSELNGAFVMLTPQWVYDGFVLENPWKEVYETVIEGETITITRNKEAEEEFVELLVALHPNFASQRNGYYYLSFADAQKKQWFLKTYHNLLEQGIELVGMDMLNHFRYSPYKVETTVTVKQQEKGKVLMQLTVAFGKEELRLVELQKMLMAGQKAVLLKDGSLGVLHDEWMQQYAAIIKHGKINKDEIEVSKVMALSEQQVTKEKEVLKGLIKEQWWQKWRQWQNNESNIYELPSTVKASLRPYQQKGFEWLTLLAEAGAGGCLADDMGLGKTLQTISFLAYFIHQNPDSVNIIVCPSSLIYNWQQELEKFTPGITCLVYHGVNRNADAVKNREHK